jgi:hypothetical protein
MGADAVMLVKLALAVGALAWLWRASQRMGRAAEAARRKDGAPPPT